MAAATSTTSPWSDEELKAKVGQLFIVGFHGHVPSEDIKTLITTYKVGSIILFTRNVQSDIQLLELTNSLQVIAKSAGHTQDLLIGIDQENGLVTRIQPPIAPQLPGAMALGSTKVPAYAYKVALATAEILKGFGINMNYAPVADVNSEPKNPVIGVRSFSQDPEIVSRFVAAQVRGFQDGGVVPCVKHFPGHGDTITDSHYGLPVMPQSRAQLESCELAPFRRAAAGGVDAVMTAHIAMTGIAKPTEENPIQCLPATLNQDVLNILREDMKYDGLIVSDCLQMEGVAALYGIERAAVMALKAGTDCPMICHTMAAQVGAIELVIQAVKSGELSQDSIQASVERVQRLKSKYLNSAAAAPTRTLHDLKSRAQRHADLASEVYAKSTKMRAHTGLFPLPTNPIVNIVFVRPGKLSSGGGILDFEDGEGGPADTDPLEHYIDLLQARNPSIIEVQFYDGVQLTQAAKQAIAEAEFVILATGNADLFPYQKEFGISLARTLGNKMIAVATCNPYDFLNEVEVVKNYITIYEPTTEAFKSAVDAIFGVSQPSSIRPARAHSPDRGIRGLTESEKDVDKIWSLWQAIFPEWPIERQRLAGILYKPGWKHYLSENGFCLAYLVGEDHGRISVVAVLPDFRGRGLGTAFIETARTGLKSEAFQLCKRDLKTFEVGSVFPRFWPGVPISFPQAHKDFFIHRGFRGPTVPTSRDLFRNITSGVAPPDVIERVSKLPFTFAPWSKGLEEECLIKQRANFKNPGWVEAYERVAAANEHHEVMVAFDENGTQIGWTFMCSPSALISREIAFLPLLPTKENTGLIACVGVDESMRKKGVGLALLINALKNMRERGIEGVMIDWVVIRGFYEQLGFDVYFEYEGYE